MVSYELFFIRTFLRDENTHNLTNMEIVNFLNMLYVNYMRCEQVMLQSK